jgi:hypothetical protein
LSEFRERDDEIIVETWINPTSKRTVSKAK